MKFSDRKRNVDRDPALEANLEDWKLLDRISIEGTASSNIPIILDYLSLCDGPRAGLVRMTAARLLGTLAREDSNVMQLLSERLESINPLEREAVVHAIGAMEQDGISFGYELLSMFNNETDLNVQKRILRTLGMIGFEDGRALLTECKSRNDLELSPVAERALKLLDLK